MSSFTELTDHPAFCLKKFRAQCWILVLLNSPKGHGLHESYWNCEETERHMTKSLNHEFVGTRLRPTQPHSTANKGLSGSSS